jgi:hypothetical protein
MGANTTIDATIREVRNISEAREEIGRIAPFNSLVYEAQSRAMNEGWSDAEFFVYLAYIALKSVELCQQSFLEFVENQPLVRQMKRS